MNRLEAVAALQRALHISHDLAAVADGGDLGLAVSLDAERLQLLKSARAGLQPMDEKSRSVLREIAALNDRALGLLEHRRRAKARDMDMLAVGRRAVRAYASTLMRR
ncbi:MAG: hypothetical protein WBF89_09520 [Steroidobacteraceae bacterium]|jgi:hypothetical protein